MQKKKPNPEDHQASVPKCKLNQTEHQNYI